MKAMVVAMFLWAATFSAIAQAAAPAPSDKLGPGDTVHVTVFQQPDLTTDTRLSDRGTVVLPLVGEVKLAGLTPMEAGAHIAHAYKAEQYLKHPQVSVAVTTLRSRQVNVLGMVTRPGRYPLDDSSSQITDVIAAAGGVAAGGDNHVTLIRDGKSTKIDLLTKGVYLKNGDTVYVTRAPVFYIYGEVNRAGAYPVEAHMTVMQALAAGGGLTPRGSDRRLRLRRADAGGKIVESDVGLQDTVKPNDVIFVREALF